MLCGAEVNPGPESRDGGCALGTNNESWLGEDRYLASCIMGKSIIEMLPIVGLMEKGISMPATVDPMSKGVTVVLPSIGESTRLGRHTDLSMSA